ncbi:MAG: putative transport system permease protein, partial [Actinomycetota bacterium]|nr:putative transport system permease protein [Actinomycetota bacterium]
MFKLTWKGLWAHKLRFALTGLAVVLGVAFMAGTQILTDTMGKTFDGIFEDANQGVDVVVRREAAVGGDLVQEVRERVDTATLNRIRAVDGVDVAAGSIEGQAALVGPDGKAETATAFGGVIGANWVEDQRLNPFTIASGHAPRARTEAVLDQSTFDADHHALGDTVTVLGKGTPRQLTL